VQLVPDNQGGAGTGGVFRVCAAAPAAGRRAGRRSAGPRLTARRLICCALPPAAVLLDTHRLWPLLLVVGAGATFDTLHGGGTLASGCGDGACLAGALSAAAPALMRWAAGVGALVGAMHVVTRHAIGGRVFTGTKWTVASLLGRGASSGGDGSGGGGGGGGGGGSGSAADGSSGSEARAAAAHYVASTAALLRTPAAHLEPPTVTRYQESQQQRVHFDGRPAGDPSGLPEFMAAGGQRLVQVRVARLGAGWGRGVQGRAGYSPEHTRVRGVYYRLYQP
jgi:hypothetical protein